MCSLGVATMDFDFISEGLAKELISGSQLLQCWEVAALLHRVLRQREKTIVTLTRAADSLNEHHRRLAIAVAGTSITGGMMIASAGCTIAGRACTLATGSAVTMGSLTVENRLCSGVIAQANEAISQDQNCAGQLKEAWEILTCMLASFCDQFQQVMSIEKLLNAVWNVYQQIKDFVTKEIIDWKGVVAKATKTLRANVQNAKRRAVKVIKPYIAKAFEVTLNFVGLEIQGGLTLDVGSWSCTPPRHSCLVEKCCYIGY